MSAAKMSAGSDGFGTFSTTDFNMQQSFLKKNQNSTIGSSSGFNAT